MKHLPLNPLLEEQDWPVKTLRTLDAELFARLISSSQITLLLHWRYGVRWRLAKTMLLSPAVVDLAKSATGASPGKRTLPMRKYRVPRN
ncbi:hypothetical protein [Yersinia intermedia]|uniref:hypothetical protein n=1 Tax=Yersinia intermedia TaxID=631 RepID=UPI0011CC924C|nr:hypothetical protein [Yersinia intermedia]